MDVERIRKDAARRCLPHLEKILSETPDFDSFDFPDGTDVAHLSWMLETLRERDDMDSDKMSRWLGYVQGVMACRKLLDMEAERERTRPIFGQARAEMGLSAAASVGRDP